MSKETIVKLSKNGAAARDVFIKNVEIKDLWHIAMNIKDGSCKYWSQEERGKISEEILDAWHRAHDLKTHIIDRE